MPCNSESRRKPYPVPNRKSKTDTLNPAFLPTLSIERRNDRSATGDETESKWFLYQALIRIFSGIRKKQVIDFKRSGRGERI